MGALRVATFNIQHGRGPDGRVDLRRLADACASLDVDMLALQEVDVGVARSHGADLAQVVAEAAGMHATFGPSTPVDGGQYGNALVTRAPATDVEVIPLPGRREPRSVLLTRVDGVSIAVTHLSVGADQHVPQLSAAVDLLRARPDPRVLLGDLNHESPDVSGFALSMAPPTWPARAPRRALDHVATDALRIEAVTVVELPVSDHRALVVTLGRESTRT